MLSKWKVSRRSYWNSSSGTRGPKKDALIICFMSLPKPCKGRGSMCFGESDYYSGLYSKAHIKGMQYSLTSQVHLHRSIPSCLEGWGQRITRAHKSEPSLDNIWQHYLGKKKKEKRKERDRQTDTHSGSHDLWERPLSPPCLLALTVVDQPGLIFSRRTKELYEQEKWGKKQGVRTDVKMTRENAENLEKLDRINQRILSFFFNTVRKIIF